MPKVPDFNSCVYRREWMICWEDLVAVGETDILLTSPSHTPVEIPTIERGGEQIQNDSRSPTAAGRGAP